MTRLPVALQSFLIQGAALLLALLFNGLIQAVFLYSPALWQLALVQGALAAGLSHYWKQPAWWRPLHAGFLPVVLVALQLGLPAWTYLAAFLLLLLFYWNSFRTRVPLYLSDRKAWQALATQLPENAPFRLIDVGSGFGGVLFYLEARFPQGQFSGTEIAPAPWLISCLRARLRRSQVAFMRRDYARLDLGAFDVVFAFLSPAAMPDLWRQAERQMRPGSLFVSLSFGIDARPPERMIPLAEGERHTLYAWRMQGRA